MWNESGCLRDLIFHLMQVAGQFSALFGPGFDFCFSMLAPHRSLQLCPNTAISHVFADTATFGFPLIAKAVAYAGSP